MNVITVYEWLNTGNNKDRVVKFLGDKPVYELAEIFTATGSITCDEALAKTLNTNCHDAVYMSRLKSSQDLINKGIIPIYHGNKDSSMIPQFGKGKKNNDFGQGFYATPNPEFGKEWAYSSYTQGDIGFLHCYELDIRNLCVLNLIECDTLVWVAELLANRGLKIDGDSQAADILKEDAAKLISLYKMDTSSYDVIIGYRADDSYFKYADDFVKGQLYKETLDKALLLGDLGLQIFVKSEKAFSYLTKISVEQVDTKYRTFYQQRDKNARDNYEAIRHERGTKRIFNFI